jgi:hypothetical protein
LEHQKRPFWAIDTGLPDPNLAVREDLAGLPDARKARVVSLVSAQHRLTADRLDGVDAPELDPAINDVADLTEAQARRQQAEHLSVYAERRRDRRSAGQQTKEWTAREADAQRRYDRYVTTEAAKLDTQLARHQAALDCLLCRRDDLRRAEKQVQERGRSADLAANRLVQTLSESYLAGLDGLAEASGPRSARHRAHIQQHTGTTREPIRSIGPDL